MCTRVGEREKCVRLHVHVYEYVYEHVFTCLSVCMCVRMHLIPEQSSSIKRIVAYAFWFIQRITSGQMRNKYTDKTQSCICPKLNERKILLLLMPWIITCSKIISASVIVAFGYIDFVCVKDIVWRCIKSVIVLLIPLCSNITLFQLASILGPL